MYDLVRTIKTHTMKTSEFCLCPRCNGKEKLDWTDHDGGICYKCEGRGYQGEQNDEFDSEILKIRTVWKNQKNYSSKIKKLDQFITSKLWENGIIKYSLDCCLVDLVYFCNKKFDSYTLGINSKFMADMPSIIVYDLYELKSYSRMLESGTWDIIRQQWIHDGKSGLVDRAIKEHSIVGENGRVEVLNYGDSITVNFLDIAK